MNDSAIITSSNIQVSDVTIREYNNEVQEVEWDTLKAAQHYYASGLCPMPCNMDKKPQEYEWSRFCHPNYATKGDWTIQETQFNNPLWFGSKGWRDIKQVGIVLGRASGGLEVIDIECASAYNELISTTQGTLAGEVIERCPMSRSVNGGAHIFLFHPDDYPVGPGEVLARAATTVEGKNSDLLIESIGEGDQVVVPTNPTAPETCKQPYMKGKRIMVRGFAKRFEDRYVCTREEILAVKQACKNLTQVELKTPKVELSTTLPVGQGSASTNSVFTEFNCTHHNQELALELLYKAGWTLDHTSDGMIHLKRPDKTGQGASATWGCTNTEHGYPYFYVFSTGAEGWEPDKPYSPWDIVQKLKYDDDRDKMLAVMNAASLRELAASIENNPDFTYEQEKTEATPVAQKVASEKDIAKFKALVSKWKKGDTKVGNTTGAMSKLTLIGKQDYALTWDQFNSIIVEWNTKTQSNWPIEVIKDLWTTTQVDAQQHGCALDKVPKLRLKTKRLSEYKIRPVNWIIKDRHGKGILVAGLSMLVGQSGLGKSTFTRYLAASVTNGGKDKKIIVDEGEVLFLCYEDDIENTILPHVVCCGGDPTKIHTNEGCISEDGKDSQWNATQLDLVKDYLEQNPNIKLVVIDVLTSLTAGTKASTNDADQTRAILEPLNKMGQEYGVAILTLHHPNKHGTNARAAIAGSTQLTATARLVWYLGQDEEDDTVRQVCKVKANYYGVSDGIAFRHIPVSQEHVIEVASKYNLDVADNIPEGLLHTVEVIDYKVATADELVKSASEPSSSLDRCATWLTTRLGTVEHELSQVLQQECVDAGHTIATFKRAKAMLEPMGLQTFKVGDKWYMRYTPHPLF